MNDQERIEPDLEQVDPRSPPPSATKRSASIHASNSSPARTSASEAVLEATGSVSHEQVRRRLSGQALLRRLRISPTSSKTWRASGPSSCFTPSTPTFSAHAGSQANRPPMRPYCSPATRSGMNLAHGRAPHARASPEFLGQNVQGGGLRRTPGRRNHRLRGTHAAGRRSNRPKLIIAGASAYSRIIDFRESSGKPPMPAASC